VCSALGKSVLGTLLTVGKFGHSLNKEQENGCD
jgi:hypothetical protein